MQHPAEGVPQLYEFVQFLLLGLPKLRAEEMVQAEPDPGCWGSVSLCDRSQLSTLTASQKDEGGC